MNPVRDHLYSTFTYYKAKRMEKSTREAQIIYGSALINTQKVYLLGQKVEDHLE